MFFMFCIAKNAYSQFNKYNKSNIAIMQSKMGWYNDTHSCRAKKQATQGATGARQAVPEDEQSEGGGQSRKKQEQSNLPKNSQVAQPGRTRGIICAHTATLIFSSNQEHVMILKMEMQEKYIYKSGGVWAGYDISFT